MKTLINLYLLFLALLVSHREDSNLSEDVEKQLEMSIEINFPFSAERFYAANLLGLSGRPALYPKLRAMLEDIK